MTQSRIEDYGLIGDTRTSALVDRSGSIDWWCVPEVDDGACFANLLGDESNGHWSIRPTVEVTRTDRRYIPGTLVLETVHHTEVGSVAVLDFMPMDATSPSIHRVVQCRSGAVPMRMEMIVRFDYGSITPWVQNTGDGQVLVAGGDGLRFLSSAHFEAHDFKTESNFVSTEGHRHHFSLTYFRANERAPLPVDSWAAYHRTLRRWHEWTENCRYTGGWRKDVVRSLITLKALSFSPTGAIAAAATTSLPEQIGSVRNWDYRYSWLRDASFTLKALLIGGFDAEAEAWATWLRRAVAGHPGEFQIMYGVHGERRLSEMEIPWLTGYENSTPVRIGNAATQQFQLDVFGEVMDTAYTAAVAGLRAETSDPNAVILALLEHLEKVWEEPDEGIWEVRGPRRHFTHSKLMAWVAFDRGVRLSEMGAFDGERAGAWTQLRDEVHAQICAEGWNSERNAFTQYYGSDELDASLLQMAPVGFLPPDDPRIVGTVEAIQEDLMVDGFVLRYRTEARHDDGDAGETAHVDGLPPGEGAFLMTTFWLADNLALMGRHDEALEIFERCRGLMNDVGLLAEEYDPKAKRFLGNFPQAFSHVSLITTAALLSGVGLDPAHERPLARR